MTQTPLAPKSSWHVHWLVWLLTIGLDTVIFGGNLGALAGYLIFAVVALPFVLAVTAVQRFVGGDRWAAAIAKALVLLLLIGIPTPVASVLGALGSVAAALSRRGTGPPLR